MGGPRIDPAKLVNIRKMYEKELLSCQMIADRVGCTRVRIWQLLKAQGVKTEDHKRESSCVICGKPVLRTRARIRDHRRVYCGNACYWVHVASNNYQVSRQGQRVARQIVSKIYTLGPKDVVHHMDGNQSNNAPNNLAVFASSSDHMRYHRTDIPVRAFMLGARRFEELVNSRYAGRA